MESLDKNKIIDQAIAKTLAAHPDFIDYNANVLYRNTYNIIYLRNFVTSEREKMKLVNQLDLIHYYLTETIDIYYAATALIESDLSEANVQNLNYLFPNFPIIKRAAEMIINNKANAYLYYLYTHNELYELIQAICSITFKKEWYEEGSPKPELRERFHNQVEKLSRGTGSDQAKMFLSLQRAQIKELKDLQVNYDAINICQREIASGNQIKQRHNEYSIAGKMFATQDVGRRGNQEDSVLIMEHKENPNFRLMAIADGMGGLEKGEQASSYALEQLSNWFNNLPVSYYDKPEGLERLLYHKLYSISSDIYDMLGSGPNGEALGGTTFVGTIICKDKTLISNVGDSRAYGVKGNRINILSKDDSLVWKRLEVSSKYDQKPIQMSDIDDLRFAAKNNVILNSLGEPNLSSIQVNYVPNSSYDKLLIFSDGVTDLLDSETIKVITNSTPPEQVTQALVQYALTHNAVGPNKTVPAGKDNASAAAFISRR